MHMPEKKWTLRANKSQVHDTDDVGLKIVNKILIWMLAAMKKIFLEQIRL